MNTAHVILSGGVGSRLWPLSRKTFPKQYIELFEGKSLFEMTLERNLAIAQERVIVGNKDNVHLSQQVLDKVDLSATSIVEVSPRNTAAAIAFAALAVAPDTIMIVTPSDHIIENQLAYESAINKAKALAAVGNLVTFGVVPTYPETGYGYIESEGDNVISFREKPNLELAKEFLASGNYLWNSGMFCFRADVFLKELLILSPELHQAVTNVWNNKLEDGMFSESLTALIPNISVDVAVMEKSKKIKVVPATFDWSDLGSFESLYDYLKNQGTPVDASGNMCIGTELPTYFVGLENVIVVSTKDVNLVLQKEAAQDVKKVYEYISVNNSELI